MLDQVAETGEPAVIEREEKTLRIVVDEAKPRAFDFGRLVARPTYAAGDGDISDVDWSHEWTPDVGDPGSAA